MAIFPEIASTKVDWLQIVDPPRKMYATSLSASVFKLCKLKLVTGMLILTCSFNWQIEKLIFIISIIN